MSKIVSTGILILIMFNNTQGQNIRIMCYNIGSTDWNGNRERVISIIKDHNPDVLAAIESPGNTRPYLESNLNDYELLRTFDNPDDSESHIFFKSNLFDVINSGFVAVETYGGYAGPARYINWGHFKEKMSEYQFIIYASHMVFVLSSAVDSATIGQYRHADTMVQLMNEHSALGIPQITVGDFNATITSDVIQFLIEQMPITYQTPSGEITIANPLTLDDSWDIVHPTTAKPGTVGNLLSAIDWIIVNQDLEISSAIIDSDAIGASDHIPLIIDIGDEPIVTSFDKFSDEKNTLSVYPNPFHSTITFDVEAIYDGNVSLKIIDDTGKVVYNYENDTYNAIMHSLELDLRGLPPEIYYYQLVTPDQTFTGSLIKSN